MWLGRAPARAIGRLGVIVVAVVCGGCSSPPVYVPETAGLVIEYEVVGPDVHFVFDDGREFSFPFDANYIGGGQPRNDAVLLAGSQPVPWMNFAGLSGQDPPGCYEIHGPATMDATHVYQTVRDPLGDVVIALPKTADWTDLGQDPGSDDLIGGGTCINRQGQAFGRVRGF